MNLLQRFYANHVLANLVFVLVLGLGAVAYTQLPRAKDPEINFNWISVIVFLPGAAAVDVERRVTDPLEDAIRANVQDIRFVSSTSRDGICNILVRFNDIDERNFDKRVADLRREVQNTYTDELPEEAEEPIIDEITTSNAFPSATVVVTAAGDDEHLRRQALNVRKDLERLRGVDRVLDVGFDEPELHVAFLPERLQGLDLSPADIADTVRAYFRDVSAGDLETAGDKWLVRLAGTDADPGRLADLPIATAAGVVPLGSIARLYRTTEEPAEIVRHLGRPAILLAVNKRPGTNVIDLVDRVRAYVEERNARGATSGTRLVLIDDQTEATRDALALMESNALLGLGLVLATTWLFLSTRIALLTSAGIPFALAGTCIVLYVAGSSLNNSVLLGIVIALGMLVDDSVVVVETIYRRLQAGVAPLTAAVAALREVFAPVTSSVLTTVAAFLPLMLMPGILGQFMQIVPLVVTLALAFSLIEAYWMLPAHVAALRHRLDRPSRVQQLREAFTRTVRRRYVVLLLRSLRHPWLSALVILALFAVAAGALAAGLVPFRFFAFDPARVFYVNVEMPPGTSLARTAEVAQALDDRVRATVPPGELRGSVAYAGQMFTQTEPLFGDTVGQVLVSLRPAGPQSTPVEAITADVLAAARGAATEASNLYIYQVKDGPPTLKPVSVKVRGDDYAGIVAATAALQAFMATRPEFTNVSTDYRPGSPEVVLRQDGDAVHRSGVGPTTASRSIGLYVDGEIVTTFQHQGEEITVRVRPEPGSIRDVADLLRQPVALRDGRPVPLGELVEVEHGRGQQNIRHYNFRRAITLEADLDAARIDTVAANRMLREEWERIAARHPDIDLDFSGELDDIQESLGAIQFLFLLGIGLIYAILGTQFRSYFQPFLIMITVPLAFTGVVIGLAVTGNPLSLYTLYGVVALAGVAVNSAIVLISAANDRLEAGAGLLHATVYAARVRVIPILITSLTTIAGLFSLATGLGGKSLVWGPVATAIVWGLAVSTLLTLFVIPLLYRATMGRAAARLAAAGGAGRHADA